MRSANPVGADPRECGARPEIMGYCIARYRRSTATCRLSITTTKGGVPKTASALFWRGGGGGRSGQRPGRKTRDVENLVIEPGSNPVHTRSSGAIRKEHQPGNTRPAGSANGDLRHVFYLYRFDRSRRLRPWPPNASTTPIGGRHDEAVFPLSSAIAGTARGGSAVAAQGAHLRRGQAR